MDPVSPQDFGEDPNPRARVLRLYAQAVDTAMRRWGTTIGVPRHLHVPDKILDFTQEEWADLHEAMYVWCMSKLRKGREAPLD